MLSLTAVAAVVAALLVPLAPAPAAQAVKATGGAGQYVQAIEWFQWGVHDQAVRNGAVTNVVEVAGSPLEITCTISNLSGTIAAYRPGSWNGDGFDDMYNSGASGDANRLDVGLSGPDGERTTFDLACSATYQGADVPLAGLVLADAEQSGASEHVGATAPAGATWRIIDRYRAAGCAQSTYAYRPVADPQRLILYGPDTANCSAGPTAVAFVQGAQQLSSVTVQGGGKSAVALGVMLSLDFGDAPASYGQAGALLQADYQGGEVATTSGDWSSNNRGVNVFNDVTLAEPSTALTTPVGTLGATVDGEGGYSASAGVSDDLSGIDDEDAEFTFLSPATGLQTSGDRLQVAALPGEPYSATISCTGTGAVRGWLDWAREGSFSAGDASEQTVCADGSATLTWNVPSNVVTSTSATPNYLRLRIGSTEAVLEPTGVAAVGEVEDHPVAVMLPGIALDKSVAASEEYTARKGDSLDYSFLVRNTGTTLLTDIELTDDMTDLQGLEIDWSTSSNAVTTENFLAAGETVVARATYTLTQTDVNVGSVVNANASVTATDVSGGVVDAQANATHPIPSNGALELLKSGLLADGMPGDPIEYTFSARNVGNVTLTDVAISDPHPGLSALDYEWPGDEGVLEPGQVVTATASAPLTQAQADAGFVDNTATVVGTAPDGSEVDKDATARVEVERTPGLTIEKSGVLNLDGEDAATPGATITYTLRVINDGNTTITDIVVTDPILGNDNVVPDGDWPGDAGTLLPGQEMLFVVTHPLTQEEINAGTLDNTAYVSGTPPGGLPPVEDEDSFDVPVEADPGIELAKTGTLVLNAAGVDDDRIDYSFTILNNGNITLTAGRGGHAAPRRDRHGDGDVRADRRRPRSRHRRERGDRDGRPARGCGAAD